MIIAVLAETTVRGLHRAVAALPDGIDGVEIRMDFLDEIDLVACKDILSSIPHSTIITVRPTSQGGQFSDSEAKRRALLLALASLQPTYMDIEHDVESAWLETFSLQFPTIKLIRSYHDFDKTPENIEDIYQSMQHPAVELYKLVTTANSALDALRLLTWLQAKPDHVIAHCMGEAGFFSRVVSAVVGSRCQYVSVQDASPIAQVCPSFRLMTDIYRVGTLNAKTKIFALLGDPVSHSVGHVFHNQYFLTQQHNAVYVKIPLAVDAMPEFLHGAMSLPFHGFSVTTPLKTTAFSCLKNRLACSGNIGAVNTIFIKHGAYWGANTDGEGTVEALKACADIAGKRVILIGAGGAAKAIAQAIYEQSPALFVIFNRTQQSAKALADEYQASTTIPDGTVFDIVIQATPSQPEWDSQLYQQLVTRVADSTYYLRLDYSKASDLEGLLEAKGVSIVTPYSMYCAQALGQLRYWVER